MKEKLQALINTLQGLEIRATYDNMNHLLGCLQTLMEIRDSVSEVEIAEETEG